ncbi:DNA repair helicase UVH6 [Acorus calamus]|uniref:DNA 5'-3' helicase n=1 Tax=Acorus calamus TaxID=4465 RepID=A0AAV9F288_ACOCL|nr:DNA repair helicase UVH6 [Acorus calamus]
MKFQIEDVTVYFPYEHIYPEQYHYMLDLKRALDSSPSGSGAGHCLLEMPTGTGKTVALLSLILSYSLSKSPSLKLLYCTRTVHEMEKTLAELKHLLPHLPPSSSHRLLALGLSSRKNLCVNPSVIGTSSATTRDSVDSGCRRLTASWVRARAAEDPSVPTCSFFENYERVSAAEAVLLPPGVYTLEDLRGFGRVKGWCPYFLARHMIRLANVVVYSYQYLLDPKVAGVISREMQRECVVVFDEAHNIDNVCIEALSVSIRKQTLDGASRNLSRIAQEIERFEAQDAGRLRAEYNRLVEGLAQRGNLPISDTWLANPALPDDILKEAVPGNIRRAERFLAVLRRLVQYLKGRLQAERVETEGPVAFVASVRSQAGIDEKTLKFCYDRLHSLMLTLEITDTDEFLHIQTVCDFATLVGTYTRGFSIIIEPFDERMPHIPDPVLQLSCHDASLAIKPVFDRFQSVIITSGTLSPIDLYPRLLNFNPVISRSFTMSLTRDCICPMILTRGSDQLPVSTKFDMRSDPGVVRNYGRLLLEMVAAVPDGIVCFFVSYSYMDGIVNSWNEMGILQDIMQHKLVFIETQDVVETTLALDNYRKACDCGRGAVFFSVARGKVAEGIDFDRHYGRLVIMFGVPFQYTLSRILLSRLEYLRETFQIKEGDFLTFDALRQAAQCVGRVIRSKADYGMMIFADKRYAVYTRHDKRSKLPGWILSHLHDAHLNLSTDMALHIAREFLRKMAQPYNKAGVGGKKTLLSQEDLEKMGEGNVEMF